MTCSSNLANNGPVGVVTFAIQTSTDNTALTGQVGFTIVSTNAVRYISGALANSYITIKPGGPLTVRFTTTTTVPGGGNFTLAPDRRLFNQNTSIACTATADGTALPLRGSTVQPTGGTADNDGGILSEIRVQIADTASVVAGNQVTVTCVDNLAWNLGVGEVKFTITTTTDTTPYQDTAYTILPHNAVRWVSAAMSDSIVAGTAPGIYPDPHLESIESQA